MTIAHTINFNLKDNITDVDSVIQKKEYSEKFSENMNSCIIMMLLLIKYETFFL